MFRGEIATGGREQEAVSTRKLCRAMAQIICPVRGCRFERKKKKRETRLGLGPNKRKVTTQKRSWQRRCGGVARNTRKTGRY